MRRVLLVAGCHYLRTLETGPGSPKPGNGLPSGVLLTEHYGCLLCSSADVQEVLLICYSLCHGSCWCSRLILTLPHLSGLNLDGVTLIQIQNYVPSVALQSLSVFQ
jgi:hypothetical protein